MLKLALIVLGVVAIILSVIVFAVMLINGDSDLDDFFGEG